LEGISGCVTYQETSTRGPVATPAPVARQLIGLSNRQSSGAMAKSSSSASASGGATAKSSSSASASGGSSASASRGAGACSGSCSGEPLGPLFQHNAHEKRALAMSVAEAKASHPEVYRTKCLNADRVRVSLEDSCRKRNLPEDMIQRSLTSFNSVLLQLNVNVSDAPRVKSLSAADIIYDGRSELSELEKMMNFSGGTMGKIFS
jgi:hypothetical protein